MTTRGERISMCTTRALWDTAPARGQAAQAQLALLNNQHALPSRQHQRYAERLTRLLPESLRICFFVNSGSEANELAVRLARAHTGREDIIVLEHATTANNTLIAQRRKLMAGGAASSLGVAVVGVFQNNYIFRPVCARAKPHSSSLASLPEFTKKQMRSDSGSSRVSRSA